MEEVAAGNVVAEVIEVVTHHPPALVKHWFTSLIHSFRNRSEGGRLDVGQSRRN